MILAAYIVFFMFSFPLIFNADRLVGTVYGILFVYSIFALTGYLYFPGYSESLNAYFGDDVGREATAFIFLSMISYFLLNLVIYGRKSKVVVRTKPLIVVSVQGGKYAFVTICGLLVIFTFGLVINYEDLSWYLAGFENLPLQISLFLSLFKMSVGFLIVIYVASREYKFMRTGYIIVPSVLYLIVFAVASAKLGNRTDPAALVVGILFYESSRKFLTPRVILGSAAIVLVMIMALSTIEYLRYEGVQSGVPLSDRIIKNDYFAPAHILFAAVAFNVIDLKEVVISNFSNALILMNYPYLQQPITDIFNPGVATRSTGYAFYVLTEGYIFMGFFGFIYNAFILSLYLRIWNAMSCFDSSSINLLLRTIFATMAINIVRGQTSYFIKYGYTFVLPVFLFAVIILGLRFGRRKLEA